MLQIVRLNVLLLLFPFTSFVVVNESKIEEKKKEHEPRIRWQIICFSWFIEKIRVKKTHASTEECKQKSNRYVVFFFVINSMLYYLMLLRQQKKINKTLRLNEFFIAFLGRLNWQRGKTTNTKEASTKMRLNSLFCYVFFSPFPGCWT